MNTKQWLSIILGAELTLLFFVVRDVWKLILADFLSLLTNTDVYIGSILFIAITLGIYALFNQKYPEEQ